MTPAARLQTAIELLDEIGAGAPAERALTGWARRSRFAGSGDRAAVRDHVFDVLRRRRSLAAIGGGPDGRALILGLLRAQGADPDNMFTGARHAPAPLSETERQAGRQPQGAEALDIPDWLWPQFRSSLGGRAEAVARALQSRAPVFLRANLALGSPAEARASLEREGIETRSHPDVATALEATTGARRVKGSTAYRDGLVELQDASSQAAVQALPLRRGLRVLDYCAGGGGKSLAMAAISGVQVLAHDAFPQRMHDLPERARRAGVSIGMAQTEDLRHQPRFDLVLADVPCSGSGSWRRDPAGKWALTPEKLSELVRIQSDILRAAAGLVSEEGVLAYATCSMFEAENAGRVRGFLAENPGWRLEQSRKWIVGAEGDGFTLALFRRELL